MAYAASVSRQEALEKNEETFIGQTCHQCGNRIRYTKTMGCIECFTITKMPKRFEARKNNLIKKLRQQAKLKNREFDISVDDVEWVTHCPILGIELNYFANRARDRDTATFDRKDPSKGYVKGNVFIISNKANSCKSDLTIEQLERMINYAKT